MLAVETDGYVLQFIHNILNRILFTRAVTCYEYQKCPLSCEDSGFPSSFLYTTVALRLHIFLEPI